MKTPPTRRLWSLVVLSIAATMVAPSPARATPATQTFTFTGAPQTFTVPPGVNSIEVTAVGAKGGAGMTQATFPATAVRPGGSGAIVTDSLVVEPGDAFCVLVGGNGVNGGNNSYPTPAGGAGGFNGGGPGGSANRIFGEGGGGGGGASEVRVDDCAGAQAVVAGGGGGGSGNPNAGGSAGADAGSAAANVAVGVNSAGGGGAGTTTEGGAGGAGQTTPIGDGAAGTSGAGGAGGSGLTLGGGGGGGGFFGGGGGGGSGDNGQVAAGGGGGSSSPTATAIDTTGVPKVTFTFDEPPSQLSIGDVTGTEGRPNTTTTFTFNVTRSGGLVAPDSVDFTSVDGTMNPATAGTDYNATNGTLTFGPGETTKTIQVTVLGDRRREKNETFFVTLTNATGATIGDGQGIGTISNDDKRRRR